MSYYQLTKSLEKSIFAGFTPKMNDIIKLSLLIISQLNRFRYLSSYTVKCPFEGGDALN